MILFKKAESLFNYIRSLQSAGKKIGFAPTMGALHPGHISLLKESKKENDLTVCSIFVNPTQFNNPEDFKYYPVTIEKDMEQLTVAGCDVLFLPSREEIYPAGYRAKHYDLGDLENILEGFYRPGHFQGVCQVVDRLLQISHPDNLYLGGKDYQQCKVIDRLVGLVGKQQEINIRIAPTIRENDGLAMSSRNLRLTPDQREKAPAIYETLTFIKDHQNAFSIKELEKKGADHLLEKGFQLDYLQIADAVSLQPASADTPLKIALVAAYLGQVRLIDNLSLN